MLAYGNYPSDIFRGYFNVPLIAVLNILPILVLTYLLYFITGRSWIAHLVVSGIVVAASVGDYYKLRFRDDPFIAADIPDAFSRVFRSRPHTLQIQNDRYRRRSSRGVARHSLVP